MAFKKKIVAALTATAAISALSITAVASVNDTNYNFRLTAYSGEDAVITPIEKRITIGHQAYL